MNTIWGKGKHKEETLSTTPAYLGTAQHINRIIGRINQLQDQYQTRVKNISPVSEDILQQLLRTVTEEIDEVTTIITEIDQLKARLAATDYDLTSSQTGFCASTSGN